MWKKVWLALVVLGVLALPAVAGAQLAGEGIQGGGGTQLPTTCSNGQGVAWNATTSAWDTCVSLSGSGDMSAATWTSGGYIKTATGGTGGDSHTSTGTAYVTAGTWSYPNAATMRTNLGLSIGTDVLAPTGNGSGLTGLTASQLPNAVADGATKGVATFAAADFNASSGVITIDYTNGQSAATGVKGFLTGTDWDTFNGKANANQTFYIGTTQVAINRSSGGLTLAGITLTAPVLGDATATTINKITITQPANGSTLTIADGKTLTVSKTLTLTGTDSTSFTFPSGSGNIGLKGTMTSGKLCVANADGNTVDCNTDTPTGLGTITAVGDITTGAAFTAGVPGKTLVWNNATSGTITLQAVSGALGTRTISFPAETGTICTTGSICTGYGATGSGLNQFASTTSAQLYGVLSDETGTASGSPVAVFSVNPTLSGLTLADATNIAVNTSTGTKIGTATNQKIGFFNATPVVQQTGNLITGLSALGLIVSGSLLSTDIPTLNQSTTGSAASVSISGQSGLLTFAGLTSTNRAKTVRDAADTILEQAGSYTPSGTWVWTSASVTWPTFNQNTSGTAANLSGTPALPNGTTATTQSAADNSTKLATTAYADRMLPLAGGTMTAGSTLITAATATGQAGLRLPHGTAPSAPTNGDLWTTTAGLYARINGGTVGPFGTSTATIGGSLAASANYVTTSQGTSNTIQATSATLSADGTAMNLASGGAYQINSAAALSGGADGSRFLDLLNNTSYSGASGRYRLIFMGGVPKVDLNASVYPVSYSTTAGQVLFTGPTSAQTFTLPSPGATSYINVTSSTVTTAKAMVGTGTAGITGWTTGTLTLGTNLQTQTGTVLLTGNAANNSELILPAGQLTLAGMAAATGSWASPGADIGTGTPVAGTFTTITAGGTVALGTNSLTMTGSIGATGARVTKVWTAALESTALPTVNGGTLAAALNLATDNSTANHVLVKDGSGYIANASNLTDVAIPTKAAYTDLNTGTDDVKFATSLALASSKYCRPTEIVAATDPSPTAAQLSSCNATTIHNYGQAAANVSITLPTAAANLGFLATVSQTQSGGYWRVSAPSAIMYLDGSGTAVTSVGFAAAANIAGAYFSCFTVNLGNTYKWLCTSGVGTLTTY